MPVSRELVAQRFCSAAACMLLTFVSCGLEDQLHQLDQRVRNQVVKIRETLERRYSASSTHVLKRLHIFLLMLGLVGKPESRL